MFKYIIALLAIIGMFALPIGGLAQDGPGQSDPNETVAPMTSFAIVVVGFVEDGRVVMQFRTDDDGQARCQHVTTSGDESFSKTVTTEVTAQLTDAELKSIKDAFTKLEVTTLKTKELKEPPAKFIVIQVANGNQRARYACAKDAYGDDAGKVKPFLDAVNKVADRLK